MSSPRRRPVAVLLGLLWTLATLASSCSGGEGPPITSETSTTNSVAASTSDPGETSAPSQTLNGPDTVPERGPLGSTWSKLSEPGVGGRITSIAFDPADPDRLFVGGDMLGIALTDDFGETWQSTFGLASWEIGDINPLPADDGRIWTGSLSGPQASADGGTTWSLQRTGMPPVSESGYTQPIETILIHPDEGSRLLAFTGNQRNWEAPGAYLNGEWQGDGTVWESSDGGASWNQLATVAPGGNIRAATYLGGDGQLLLAAVANRGVWKSTDGGASWSEAAQGLPHFNAYDVIGHPTDPLTAWVAMGDGPNVGGTHVAGGIWATTDGGSTWTAANNGLSIVANATPGNTGSFHQIVSAPSEPNRLYTSNVAPGQAAIYRSDDGGGSWTVIADGTTARPNPYEGALRAYDIAVHPSDPDRIAIGSDDTLLGSTNGGNSWDDLTTLEEGRNFFAGRGYSGLVTTDIVFDARLPDDVILLGFDGGNFIQSIDGGETWRRTVQDISAWGGGVEAVYSPNNPERIYVLLGQFSNFRGIGVSDDGGASFSLIAGPQNGLPAVGNVDGGAGGLAVLEANGTDVVLAVIGQQLWRSIDDARTFEAVGGLSEVQDVAVSGDGSVYVATATEVLVSVDGGAGFNEAGRSPTGIISLHTSASEPDQIYAASFRNGNSGAFTFDGEEWTRIFEDFYTHAIAVDPENPANLAIVTTEPAFHDVSNATGVHLSNDGGRTWTIVNDGLPMTRARAIEFDPHNPDRLVVGTTGRGFYEISFSLALAS